MTLDSSYHKSNNPPLLRNAAVSSKKLILDADMQVEGLQVMCDQARVTLKGTAATEYIAKRLEDEVRPATISYELALLKRMFSLAIRAEKLIHRPFIPSIEVRNTRSGFFEESEFRAVLGFLPAEIQPVAEFAYLTGWRISEILSLQWHQVDFQAGIVRLAWIPMRGSN